MATKWKKWKNSIGFLAFVLSISLLITGGMDFWYSYRMVGAGSLPEALELAVEEDFQDSRAFRDYISGKLRELLAMGSENESYNFGYWDGYGYWDSYGAWNDNGYWDTGYAYAVDSVAEDMTEDAWEQETEDTAENAWEQETEGAAGDDREQKTEDAAKNEEPDDTESGKKAAKSLVERYHEYIKDDKNLLYQISNSANGKESIRYSNMDSVIREKNSLQLPDGYNFYLHFDGEQVEIQKDGAELDVYGDGIFREREDWYVPGFKNLTGKTDWKNLDIVMMVRKEPAIYYGAGTGYSYGSELYYMHKQYMERHQNLKYSLGLLAAGFLLFLLYLLRRKDKQAVMGWITAHTGKVWFECKLLLLFLLPLWICSGGWIGERIQEATVDAAAADTGEDIYYGGSWEAETGVIMEASGYDGSGIFDRIAVKLWYVFGYQFGSIVQVLLAFWLLYLFFYDLYKNHRGYQNSLTAKYLAVLSSRSLQQRLAVRMVKRFYPVFVLSLAALLFAGLSVGFWRRIGINRTWYLMVIAVCVLTALLLAEYLFQKKNRRFAQDLEKLAEKIRNIRAGNYTDTEEFTAEDSDLRHMALDLEEIRQGMAAAVEEQLSSERMKVELVANVSHDIKTPLTSIVSYIKLLQQEENLPEHVQDYIRILDEKSQRLKTMVQDVFSISKAASGQLAVELEELDFGKLLYQTLADMEEEIAGSPIVVKTEIPKEPVLVVADGGKMYRVFQNLIGNAVKYSLEGSRVYVTLKQDGMTVAASVKNTSSQELNAKIDFAERFTRGDQSRTDGGSGLGLSIAKSFTEACGGEFSLEVIADLFVVTVSFPVRQSGE